MNTKKSSTTVLDIFKEHRTFSILTIILPSLFFTALLFFSFTTNGLRETALRASTSSTDHKVYLQTSSSPANLDAYHGEIIGTLTHYQDPIINGGYRILSASSVQDFLTTNLSSLSILIVTFSILPISFLLASARLTPRHISRTI